MSALPDSTINQPIGTSADWTRGYRWALVGGCTPSGRAVCKAKRAMFMRGYNAGKEEIERLRLTVVKINHVSELLAA